MTADPVLTVIVAIVSDTTKCADVSHLDGCLTSLMQQTDCPTMEIIVPHHPAVIGIAGARERFPLVKFVEIADLRTYRGTPGSREHHDEIRSRGLSIARGGIVALTEDHAIPVRDWCARVVEAHREEVGGVAGAIQNGVDRPLNWAVYFCDFLKFRNPLPAGDTTLASDVNVAYKRESLESIRSLWDPMFDELSVNGALRARGERLANSAVAVVNQNRLNLRVRPAMEERFVWGRSFAARRIRSAGWVRRIFWIAFVPLLPALLIPRMLVMALKKPGTAAPFLKALPLTALLLVSWSMGEFTGYLTGRAN